MAIVDFLHHGNPPTWTGVELAILSAEGEHRIWSVEDWKREAWSNESPLRLLNADERLRIWRQAMKPRILHSSDEAHIWLNGYVIKQNCHIWSEANPQVYVETPLHPEKLTVWCALWAGGVIGPYFFKNDEGHNVTVNSDRYRAMITNFSFLN
ncbi:uncharacterized protein TNCV_3469641 [Trichonephila clavipes]|nr:uncharacterized protein TNCV_3469641 [Trichonephila clavipes]